jgi:hypothetical protein
MRGNERAIIGTIFGVLCAVVGFAWSAMAGELVKARDAAAAAGERIAVVETKAAISAARLERIEEKLDELLVRVPPR